jgi:hypothetical protein
VAGITAKGKRVRFHSTVDLVNELEKEKREGKAGRIALALMPGVQKNTRFLNHAHFTMTPITFDMMLRM